MKKLYGFRGESLRVLQPLRAGLKPRPSTRDSYQQVQSSLRDFTIFVSVSRHSASRRAGLITIAPPALTAALKDAALRLNLVGDARSRGQSPSYSEGDKRSNIPGHLRPQARATCRESYIGRKCKAQTRQTQAVTVLLRLREPGCNHLWLLLDWLQRNVLEILPSEVNPGLAGLLLAPCRKAAPSSVSP